jgi:alpha-mannosidase
VQSALRIRRKFLGSEMTQDVVLAAGGRRVEFRTWIDWKEQHKLLKVRFHTAVRARHATYDIAYANIERPTTRNNSYEKAKFEVCGHQWMDLSQPDHGLSLLTDCKYGYEAFGRRIGLSLLKGPKYPDPVSDQEEHRFTYALFPHAGSWAAAGTIEEAADLNDPADAVVVDAHPGRRPARHSFLELDAPGVTLEAVKRAENSDDLVIRVVERHGAETPLRLRLASAVNTARECNLLEDDAEELPVKDNAVAFDIRSYEIRTMKIRLSP